MLKIYGVPISVHTRKAIVVAIHKQLEHEVVPVVPVIPDNPPPDWRRLSPTGKIPALADGSFTLADSAAICAYLERLQPEPSVYPREARHYASALAVEQYAGTLFRDVVHPLFHETFVHPKVQGIATNQRRIDEVLTTAVPETFGYLESLAANEYLVGNEFSIADIAVASNLITFQYIGFALPRDRYRGLARWFDRVLAVPAVEQAIGRERPVVDSMGLKREFLAGLAA